MKKNNTILALFILSITFGSVGLVIKDLSDNISLPDATSELILLPINYENVPTVVARKFYGQLGHRVSGATIVKENRLVMAKNAGLKIYLNASLQDIDNNPVGIFYYWWHNDLKWSEGYTAPFNFPQKTFWYCWNITSKSFSPEANTLEITYIATKKFSSMSILSALYFFTTGVLMVILIFFLSLLKSRNNSC